MYFAIPSLCLVALVSFAGVQAAPANAGSGLAPRWASPEGLRQPLTPAIAARANKDSKDKSKSKNKSNNKNNNDNKEIDITVTDIVVDEKTSKGEIIFEEKVTKILIKNKGSNKKKNQKRKDSMKSKNKDKNVVIQIVQVVIDVSKGNSKRYAMSTILADNGKNATTTCQITDAQTLTVGAGNCTGIDAAATDASAMVLVDGTATATAAIAAVTGADLAAPFSMANQTMLLPANASAPVAAAGVDVMADPAADLVDDSTSTC